MVAFSWSSGIYMLFLKLQTLKTVTERVQNIVVGIGIYSTKQNFQWNMKFEMFSKTIAQEIFTWSKK